MPHTFTSTVTEGRLHCGRQIAQLLRCYEGKRVWIEIKQIKNRRSINQNSFYWGVMIPMIADMFREAGTLINNEDVHEFLKQEVMRLQKEIITPTGQVVSILGTTTELSTLEWEAAMDAIRVWAAEFGVEIPYPNEQLN